MGVLCSDLGLNPESFAHRMRSIWSAICIGELAAGSGGGSSEEGGNITPAIRNDIGEHLGELLGDLLRLAFCFIALELQTESSRTREDCTILANALWASTKSAGGPLDCGILYEL